jgi:hypothetical protein
VKFYVGNFIEMCPRNSVNESLHKFMKTSHEILIALKKRKEDILQKIETRFSCQVHLS